MPPEESSPELAALGGARASLERPPQAASSPPIYSQPVTFHYEIQTHTSRMQKISKAFNLHRLTVFTLLCLGSGLVIGSSLRPYTKDWSERQFMYVEMLGKLYLRLMKLILLPLLVSNTILAFGTIHRRLTCRMAKVAGLLYLTSNLLAVMVAIGLALVIHPGSPPAHHLRPPTPHPSGSSQQPQEQPPAARDLRPHPRMDMNYFNQNIKPQRPTTETTNEQQQQTDSVPETLDPKHEHYMNTYYDQSSAWPSNTNHQEQQQQQHFHQLASAAIPKSVAEQNFLIESNRIKDHHHHQQHQNLVSAAHLIHIGNHHQLSSQQQHHQNMSQVINKLDNRLVRNTKLPVDVLLDVFFNLVPDSLIGATLQQTRIRLFAPKDLVINSNGTTDPSPSRWPLGHETVAQANIMGLLTLSILTGVMLGHMQEAGKPILDLCSCVAELSLRLGLWAANLMPICIMFLLIGQLARVHDLQEVISTNNDLFMYSATVLAALLVHGFLLLPLFYYLVTRKSPLTFLMAMLEALVAAFATSSSAASTALMLNCLSKSKLSHVIVGAFGPLGLVFNRNGTAIYEVVGAIFIAQTLGANLPMTSLLLVGLVASLASFSTCGVPSSGLISMVIVLNAINLPVLQLGLLYVIDFAIDRFRTVVNVWSGSIVCALIGQICSRDLFNEELKRKKYHESMRLHDSGSSLLNSISSRTSHSSLANVASEPSSPIAASALEVAAKPKVISITITPPLENSHV